MEYTRLGKDVFLALATIAWADGVVAPAEAEALVRAARASGLAGDDLAAVEAALRERSALDVVGTLHLDDEEKLYVFCLAHWIAGVDGFVDDQEKVALTELGDRLGLSADDRARAAGTAALLESDSTASTRRSLTDLARAIERAAAE